MSTHTNEALVAAGLGTVLIRSCRPEDFEGVLRLLAQLWPNQSLDPDRTRRVFNLAWMSHQQIYLCATLQEEIVGFGSLTIKNNLWQQGHLANVDELVVEEKHRRRGIGARLLEHLVALAVQRGCRRVELDSSFHREQAHHFYETLGFQKRAYLFSKVL